MGDHQEHGELFGAMWKHCGVNLKSQRFLCSAHKTKFASPLSRSLRRTKEDTTGLWSTRSFGAKKWPMQRVLPNRQGMGEMKKK